jgi:hypothetical protein
MILRDLKPVAVVIAVLCLVALALPVFAADEIEGKIKSIGAAPDFKMVVTDQSGIDWRFPTDDATRVRINGKEGKLTDLKAGDVVFVTHMGADGFMLATEIRVLRK